jgi:hypothetical protein
MKRNKINYLNLLTYSGILLITILIWGKLFGYI